MRKLPTSFRKHGCSYEQAVRDGDFAVFFVKSGSRVTGYEVVRIRTAKAQKLPDGTVVPERETYPSDEEFGRHGWYFMADQREAAWKLYTELCHGKVD